MDPYGSLPPVSGLSFANVYSPQNTATVGYLPFWPLVTGLLYIAYSSLGFGNRFVYYFLLKQPIIMGDLSLAYLLCSYISSRTAKNGASTWALRFWLFSPFTVILSSIWGMFDSLAMSFVLLSIMTTVYAKRDLSMGLGIFTKSLAAIYALPVTFRKGWGWMHVTLAVSLPLFASLFIIYTLGWSIPSAAVALTSTIGKGGVMGTMSAWDGLGYLFYWGIYPPIPQFVYRILGLIWIPVTIAFTILAYLKLGFETDYGLVQSMLLVTLAFLIFKARVTEQYSIYLLALGVIDVGLFNPQRKNLLTATMATALIYLVLNNFFMVRFLSPVYPAYTQFELSISQLEPIRVTLLLVCGVLFTLLNIIYLIAVLKQKRS